MFDKLFNKTNPESKVVKDTATPKGIAAMRIVAKETLLFPSMAKQLRSLSNTFSRFVKLHNIQPAVGGQISDLTKSLSESKEIKVANIKVKKYGKEKKRTFLAGILDKLVTLIKLLFIGTLLSIGYIVYKVTEIITPYVEDLISKVKEGIGFISDGIKSLYENTDWLNLFESSFKKYLSFLSFGLISEEQVGNYIMQAGSFYKEMIKGIGKYIEMAVEWLSPRLQQLGRVFAIDVLGVDVDKLEERRTTREILVKKSKELEEEYSKLDRENKDLTEKKDNLAKEKQKLEEEKRKKQKEEAEKEAQRRLEEEKKKPFLERLFRKEEKKLPPIEERPVTPTPAPKKEEPKIDVNKVPPSDGTMAPLPEPAKEPSSSVSLQSVVKDNSPKFTPIDYSGLKPEFEKLLVQMATAYTKETGQKLLINSAYRSNQEQKELYDKWIASGKKGGVVARPAAPLKGADGTSGAGSPHTGGTAIDIQAKGQMFGTLAGDVDNPKGWLEKFGLTRPVTSSFLIKQGKDPSKREDWHVTPLKSLPTPDGDIVPNKSGKPVDLATGKQAPDYDIGKSSSELSKEQREQSKPQNPTYINARTTNNVVAETKRTNVAVPA